MLFNKELLIGVVIGVALGYVLWRMNLLPGAAKPSG